MNTKHTPGPFEVQDPMGSDVGFWIVQAGLEAYEWSCIAIVPRDDERSGKHFITKAEQKANASLFAAAPMMLEALKAVHEPYRHLTNEALEAGVLMEFGPPKPEKGAALLLVRTAIFSAQGEVSPSPTSLHQ